MSLGHRLRLSLAAATLLSTAGCEITIRHIVTIEAPQLGDLSSPQDVAAHGDATSQPASGATTTQPSPPDQPQSPDEIMEEVLRGLER